jgi:hypothetical protein
VPVFVRALKAQAFVEAARWIDLHFAEMDHIITQLGLDMGRQRESFARQWHVAKVRIITLSGEGIGTWVLQMLIEKARRAGKPVILRVV